MTNRKSTKRALLGSVMAMVLCLAMLVGATFAWFTDTASTGVNKIQAGNLDVALEMKEGDKWVSAEGKTLNWVKAAEGEQVLWEPGCTYKLPELRVVNNGNLALKYKIEITGIKGSAKLNSVIDWTINDTKLGDDHILAAKATSESLTIQGKMQESAGNDYMNESIDGISITVYATQAASEYDSFNNEYDKNATYGTAVSTATELADAVKEGGVVVLNNDIDLTSALSVPAGKEVVIDLNGKTVTANNGFVNVTNAKVTLNGNGTVKTNKLSAVYAGAGSEVTVNGGNYNSGYLGMSAENGGKLVVNNADVTAVEGAVMAFTGSTVEINGGNFTATDNFVIATNGSKGMGGNTITVNGGTFNGKIQSAGYIACGVYVANNDTVNLNSGTFNITNGVGVLARAGQTTIGKDVVINLTNDGTIASGKVGDSKVLVPCTYVVKDLEASYPGTAPENFEVNSATYTVTVLEK